MSCDVAMLYPSWFQLTGKFAVALTRGPLLALLAVYFIQWVLHQHFSHLDTIAGMPRDMALFVLGTMFVHSATYFVVAGSLTMCSLQGWLKQYEMPRTARMIPSRQLLRATILKALFGQLITSPIVLVLLFYYKIVQLGSVTVALPPWYILWKQLALSIFFNELLFYIAHRTLHEVPFLYRTIHKQHHKYVGTVAIAAEFANPFEDAFANQISTSFYCFAAGVPLPVWLAWLFWRLFETYEGHSGFCFRETWFCKVGLLNSEKVLFHDFHHTENKGNYGSHLFDLLFGTADAFLIHQRREREQQVEKKL